MGRKRVDIFHLADPKMAVEDELMTGTK